MQHFIIDDEDTTEEESVDNIYLIPNVKMDRIEKRVERIKKKAEKQIANMQAQGQPTDGISLPVFEIVERNVQVPAYKKDKISGNQPIGYVSCTRIRVSGEYRISDWICIARIDH